MKNNLLFVAHSIDMDSLVRCHLETSSSPCPRHYQVLVFSLLLRVHWLVEFLPFPPTELRAEAVFLNDSLEQLLLCYFAFILQYPELLKETEQET